MKQQFVSQGLGRRIILSDISFEGKTEISIDLVPEIIPSKKKNLGDGYFVQSDDCPVLEGVKVYPEDILSFRRMLGGIAPRRECALLAGKFYGPRKTEIVAFLENAKLVKELQGFKPKALPKNILVEYIARDGYRITVEEVGLENYSVIEYVDGKKYPSSKMSKERALKAAADSAEMVSKLDNVKFRYYQY